MKACNLQNIPQRAIKTHRLIKTALKNNISPVYLRCTGNVITILLSEQAGIFKLIQTTLLPEKEYVDIIFLAENDLNIMAKAAFNIL